MQYKQNKHKISIVTVLIAVILCGLCAFALTACNNNFVKENTVDREYKLYLAGLSYSEDEGVIYGIVTLKGDEESELNSSLSWHSRSYEINTWYNGQNVEMTLNPSDIYADVLKNISEEQWIYNDVQYNGLKVVLRYDTIYKSINSDADSVVKSGRYYLHRFNLDEETESKTCAIWLKSANSASWYTILIVCGIAFAAVLCGVMLLVKGGVWQKKKTKNE